MWPAVASICCCRVLCCCCCIARQHMAPPLGSGGPSQLTLGSPVVPLVSAVHACMCTYVRVQLAGNARAPAGSPSIHMQGKLVQRACSLQPMERERRYRKTVPCSAAPLTHDGAQVLCLGRHCRRETGGGRWDVVSKQACESLDTATHLSPRTQSTCAFVESSWVPCGQPQKCRPRVNAMRNNRSCPTRLCGVVAAQLQELGPRVHLGTRCLALLRSQIEEGQQRRQALSAFDTARLSSSTSFVWGQRVLRHKAYA